MAIKDIINLKINHHVTIKLYLDRAHKTEWMYNRGKTSGITKTDEKSNNWISGL